MPFTLRAFEEEKNAKMGVVECERHGLLQPYQVISLPFLNIYDLLKIVVCREGFFVFTLVVF